MRLTPNLQLALQPSSQFLCLPWTAAYFKCPSVLSLTPLLLNGTIKPHFFYPVFQPFMMPNAAVIETDHTYLLCRKLKGFGGKSKTMGSSEKRCSCREQRQSSCPAGVMSGMLGHQAFPWMLMRRRINISELCVPVFPQGFLQSNSRNLCTLAEFQPFLLSVSLMCVLPCVDRSS